MFYDSWFHGHGRAILADGLEAEDPFGLTPGEIVDAVVKAGWTPVVDRPQSEPFRSFGSVTEVERERLVYLVAVSRDAEEISVQAQSGCLRSGGVIGSLPRRAIISGNPLRNRRTSTSERDACGRSESTCHVRLTESMWTDLSLGLLRPSLRQNRSLLRRKLIRTT